MARLRTGWKQIINGAGRNVFVLESHYPLYEQIKRDHHKNFHLTSLLRTLWMLNADATIGQPVSADLRVRRVAFRDVALEYYVDDTDVLIRKLIYSGAFRPSSDRQGMGLYQVQYNPQDQDWTTNDSPAGQMKLEHQWNGSHYAAVAGKFSRKEVAGSALIKHIGKAYNKDIPENHLDKEGHHYSLLWINQGEHKAEASSQALASLIQQAADAGKPVSWLVHGEGAMTFQRATHALKSHLASAPRALNANAPPTLAGSLAGQRVFFSNPRGISQSELKKSCAAVGLTFVKANINPRDMNSPDVWRNVAKEIGKLSWSVTKTVGVGGGGGVAAAVVSGSGLNEAVTKAAELWQAASALASGVDFDNAATAAIAAGAAGVAIVTSYSKVSTSFLAMRALATSTFGRGNEFWYEDDKSLLRQLRA